MKCASLIVLIGLSSCAGAGVAPTPETARPSRLVGPVQKLAFYVGNWSCQGKEFATPTTKEENWTARIEVRPEAGGGAVAVHMFGPGDNLTAEIKGYNTKKNRWFHIWMSRDGSWGSTSSDGFDGDRMISVDDDPASGGKKRTIFTKLGETRYSHREEADDGSGFHGVWEKVCEKAGS